MSVKNDKSVSQNMIAILIYQLVALVAGLLVPKMILETYGAQMHGLTSTITNLSQYIMLINTGIVNVAMSALYKPFAESNYQRVNEVVNAARKTNFRMGNLSAFLVTLLAFVLAFIIHKDGIAFQITVLITLVMGMQQVLERYLICTYQIIVQASQRMYVVYIINTISYALRCIIQIGLIHAGVSLVLVQAVPASLLVVSWIMLRAYITKNYPLLDKNVRADDNVLKDRKYAFAHTTAGIIVNNSSVLLLTVFCNQIAVSIFAVYNLVIQHLHNVILTIFSRSNLTQIGKAAKTESVDELRERYSRIEITFCIIVAIAYSVCSVGIIPFVNLYTRGQSAVDYINYPLCFSLLMFGVFNGLREPGIMILDALAHYKQTQRSAILEAVIDVVVSVIGVCLWGISGVALGLASSFVYRYFVLMRYVNCAVLGQPWIKSLRRGAQSLFIIAVIFFLLSQPVQAFCTTWFRWLCGMAVMSVASILIAFALFGISDRKEIRQFSSILYQKLHRGRG